MVSFYVGDKTIAAAIGGTIGGVVAVVMVVGIIVVVAVLILIRGKLSHDYYHIAYWVITVLVCISKLTFCIIIIKYYVLLQVKEQAAKLKHQCMITLTTFWNVHLKIMTLN